MKLSDINWDDSSITIRQSKTGTLLNHKLTTAAGNSLASYLLEERPKSPCDKVFLKRDGCAIGSPSTISSIISIAFINSGIRVGERRHGSHCLRHSLATAMLNNGIGIFEISRVLGHACADTSRIYSKVDIESLRLCELEVPCHG